MTPAISQPWIDHPSYFGPNRRAYSRAFRVRERRHDDLSGPAPSLNVALRKLRLHVFDATPGRKAAAFAERVLGASIIAGQSDVLDVQVKLEDLNRQIMSRPERDWRPAIYRTLDDLSIETYAVH